MSHSIRFGVSLFSLATALSAGQALAQAQAVVPPSAADPSVVQEVVVTSQRRAERLQDVPLSVTAFNAQDLSRGDIVDISRLANFTPGFTYGQSSLEARPAIRGVRTENVAGNGDPTIGFYIDDIYQSRAVQASQPFVDINRVEVQRGPQGTLYGRNTFGGNIAVNSNLPGPTFDWGSEAVVGDYGRLGGQGFVNLPVNDQFGLRVAASREKRDGYVEDTAGAPDLFAKDSTFLRLTAKWNPTERFEAVARTNYWYEGGSGGQAFAYHVAGGIVDPITGARTLSGVVVRNVNFTQKDGIPDINGIDIGAATTADPYKFQGDYPATGRIQQYAGSLQLKYTGDWFVLRSITGYQEFKYSSDYDGDALPQKTTAGSQLRKDKALSEELQISSKENKPLQWIAGVYYFDDDVFEIFRSDLISNGFYGPDEAKTKSYAGFAQASYFLTPKLKITGGARYTNDDKTYYAGNFNSVNGALILTSQGTFAKTFTKTTYHADVDYFLRPNNLVYFNFSTGFRSGGFNGGALTNPAVPFSFSPEKVNAYEIGSKNRFLDGKLQVNAAAYYNDFTNLQVQTQFLYMNTAISTIRNAGAANAKGLELETIYKPIPALTLNATATIMDAKYTQYISPPPAGYAGSFLNLSGNKIPYAPDYKFSLGARYDISLGQNGVITPSGSVVFVDGYYNTDYNTVLDRQGSYQKVDLSVAWRSVDGRYGVELFGENLTDVAVINRAVFGSGGLTENYEPPRMFGLRFTARH